MKYNKKNIEVEGETFKAVVFDPNSRNSRFIYSQEIIDRELSKYAERIKDSTALGRFISLELLDINEVYPASFKINPLESAFVATNLIRNENGSWVVEGKTFENFYGKMVHSMLVDGLRMKPILTGFGNVDENNVVGDDFSLITIDIMLEGTKEIINEI